MNFKNFLFSLIASTALNAPLKGPIKFLKQTDINYLSSIEKSSPILNSIASSKKASISSNLSAYSATLA